MHNDLLVGVNERVFKERNRDWGMRESIVVNKVVLLLYSSRVYVCIPIPDKDEVVDGDADSAHHMISTTTPESAPRRSQRDKLLVRGIDKRWISSSSSLCS